MIVATRSVLDAGDYDPKLADRIERLEEVPKALEKQKAGSRLCTDLAKLVADLKRVRDGNAE
jgi:hypothetical protein